MKFINRWPGQSEEWDAFIHLLNDWTEESRQLRFIVQNIRSGPFYPADVFVDLFEQHKDRAKPRLQVQCPKCRANGYSGIDLAHKPDCPDKDFQ